jgi:hypothetical protein
VLIAFDELQNGFAFQDLEGLAVKSGSFIQNRRSIHL